MTQPRKTPLAKSLLSVALLSLAAGFSGAMAQEEVAAEVNAERSGKGYEIAARSDRTDSGFGASTVGAEMILRNRAGQESRRVLSFRTLERANEEVGDKSLVVFETPRDVEGTALLSHAKILAPDDQWLFLPALKRVKRISSANKSGPFVGSEFAFEDFTSTELHKYSYKFLREEEVDGVMMDVVERYPLYERSGYTRQISWVDQEVHQVRRIDFYDRKDTLLKTLTLSDYREYDGIWRTHTMTMVNHQSGKTTDLVYTDYNFDVDLSDSDFTKGVLTRIR